MPKNALFSVENVEMKGHTRVFFLNFELGDINQDYRTN